MFGIFNRNSNPDPNNLNSHLSSNMGVDKGLDLGYIQHGTDTALRGAVFFDYFFNNNRNINDSYDPYVNIGHSLNKEEVQRMQYMKYHSKDRTQNPNLELQEHARIALASNAFTSFSADLYNVTLSGTKVINRVINKSTPQYDFSSLSPLERERREREVDKYAASNIYRYLFAHDTYETAGKKIFKNLNVMDPKLIEQSTEYGTEYDGISQGRWLINNILNAEERSSIANVAKIHQELILLDPERLSKSRKGVYSNPIEAVKQVSDRIIQDKEYLSKPGIRQAVAFIESAEKELTIDLFQLQNKAISDVLINKLTREKDRIAKGDFKFKIRLGAPTGGDRENLIGHHILGPNIIIMQRLGNLRDEILFDQLGYRSRPNNNINEIVPFFSQVDMTSSYNESKKNEVDKILSDSFSLEFMDDGMYHPKLFTSDKVAMVGSFNLTSPVGSSIFQSGSNYEEIQVLRNRLNLDYDKAEQKVNDYMTDPSKVNIQDFVNRVANKEKKSRYGNRGLNPQEKELLDKDTVETMLYLQARILSKMGVQSPTGGGSITGLQIGKAGDIGQALRASIGFLQSDKIRGDGRVSEMYMNLNQVWLLQLDNDLFYGAGGDFTGEFGPSGKGREEAIKELKRLRPPVDDSGMASRRFIYKSEVQSGLFDLIHQGRAFISVDQRTYRDKILTPMEEKVNYLLGRKEIERRRKEEGFSLSIDSIKRQEISEIGKGVLLRDYDGSMAYLVRKAGNDDNLRRTLGLSKPQQPGDLGSYNYQNSSMLFEGRKDLSTMNHIHETSILRTLSQLKAVTSGQIVPVTETMSHVKNFMVIERSRGQSYDPVTGEGITPLSYVSGSSNFGSSSLAFEEGDKDYVSSESGLILLGDKIRNSRDSKKYLSDKDKTAGLSDEYEELMLKARAKFPIREWKRLTNVEMGNFDYTGATRESVWNDRVSRQGLEQVKKRIERINEDLGTNAISLIPSYDSKGDLSYYTIKFSNSSAVGSSFNSMYMGSSNEIKYRVTVLKDIKGQPGFVYMIDQNKVLGNTRLMNQTDESVYGLPYALEEGQKYRRIEAGESLELNPLDTFANLMGTLLGESSFRTMVEEPMRYIKVLSGSTLKSKYLSSSNYTTASVAGLGYLRFLGTGIASNIEGKNSKGIFEFFNKLDARMAHEISREFYSKHISLTAEGRKGLEMSAGLFDPTDMNNSRTAERHSIINALSSIAVLNEKIQEAKKHNIRGIGKIQSERNQHISFILNQFDNILGRQERSTFESDISLGVIESLRDITYYQGRDNNIKQIKQSIFEPFISLGQASIYANSQAWYKNPIFALSPYSIEYFKEGTNISENPSMNNIMRYALASPYSYSSTDPTGKGTEGFIRSVAEGGGGKTTEEEGYSLFGDMKTTFGDITSIDILKYTGTGNIVKRSEYENTVIKKLYLEYQATVSNGIINISLEDFTQQLQSDNPMGALQPYKDIFKRLIQDTPFKDESIDRALVFNFNVPKKASQIPQRLKNVLGSKPMYEMDSGFSILLRKKGVLTSTEMKYFKKFLEQKHRLNRTKLQESIKKINKLSKSSYSLSPDQYLEAIIVSRQVELMKARINNNNTNILTHSKNTKRIISNVLSLIEEDLFNTGIDSFVRKAEELIWNDKSNSKTKEREKIKALEFIKEAYQDVNQLVGESSKVSIINDSDLRNYMTSDQHEIVEGLKDNLSEIYGFDRDEYMDHGSLARASLLNILKMNDSLASGIKGFTTGRTTVKGKKSVILVQLSGGFSDYGFTNPLYGSDINFLKEARKKMKNETYKNPLTNKEIELTDWSNLSREDKMKLGMMSGFLEKAEKRQKSSMLVEDWFIQGNRVARKGDIVTYDNESNRVLVWGDKRDIYNSMIPLDKIDMEKISRADRENLKKAAIGDAKAAYYFREDVDSRDQASAIAGTIDNFRVIDDLPTVSLLERQAWHRNSEESYEYLISAKQLSGVADTNQLIWEFTYNRSIMMGGGRRGEGTSSLVKAVNVFLQPNIFERLAASLNEFGGGTLKADPLSIENIMGLYSPTNFKSYAYSHGAEILSNKELRENFMAQLGVRNKRGVNEISSKQLGALMLLTFGDTYLEDSSKKNIYSDFFGSALSGELGEWMKGLALSSVLSTGKDITLNQNEISRLMSGALLNDDSDLKKLMVSNFQSMVSKKSKDLFGSMQLPSIDMIDSKKFELSFTQGGDYMKKFLSRQLGAMADLDRDYILGDVMEERMASIMVGNLELMSQLIAQDTSTVVPTDINVEDNKTLIKLLSISGYQDIGRIQDITIRMDNNLQVQREEREYVDSMREILKGLTNTSNIVRLYGSVLPSASKEAVGSKLTGALEFQHMVKPLYQFSSSFTNKGELSDLRKVLGNVLSTISQTESMITGEAILRRNDLLTGRPVDISDMNSLSSLDRHKFIGINTAYDPESIKQLRELKRDYRDYEEGIKYIIADKVKQLNNLQGDSSLNRLKRLELTSEISDLMTLQPDFLYEGRAGYMDEEIEYLTVKWDKSQKDGEVRMRRGTQTKRIKSIVRSYMKSNKGKKIYSRKGTELNILESLEAVSGRMAIDIGRVQQALNPDTPFGMGTIQPVLEGLDYRSFSFSLPSFMVEGQDESGGVSLSFDYSDKAKRYSYLMGASELQLLGDQYGSYVEELTAKTIYLASAFAPGSNLSIIMDKIKRSKLSGDSRVSLTKEEYTLWQRYYETAVGNRGIVPLLAEASANVRSQQVMAGKIRLAGIVTTPAASFLVNPGDILLAQEGERRQIHMSENRYTLYREAISKEAQFQRIMSDENELAKYGRGSISRVIDYYSSLQSAMLYGLSEPATLNLSKFSDEFTKLNEKIDKYSNKDFDKVAEHLSNQIARLNDMDLSLISPEEGKGDSYLKNLQEVSSIYLRRKLERKLFSSTTNITSKQKVGLIRGIKALESQVLETTSKEVENYISLKKLGLADAIEGIQNVFQGTSQVSQYAVSKLEMLDRLKRGVFSDKSVRRVINPDGSIRESMNIDTLNFKVEEGLARSVSSEKLLQDIKGMYDVLYTTDLYDKQNRISSQYSSNLNSKNLSILQSTSKSITELRDTNKNNLRINSSTLNDYQKGLASISLEVAEIMNEDINYLLTGKKTNSSNDLISRLENRLKQYGTYQKGTTERTIYDTMLKKVVEDIEDKRKNSEVFGMGEVTDLISKNINKEIGRISREVSSKRYLLKEGRELEQKVKNNEDVNWNQFTEFLQALEKNKYTDPEITELYNSLKSQVRSVLTAGRRFLEDPLSKLLKDIPTLATGVLGGRDKFAISEFELEGKLRKRVSPFKIDKELLRDSARYTDEDISFLTFYTKEVFNQFETVNEHLRQVSEGTHKATDTYTSMVSEKSRDSFLKLTKSVEAISNTLEELQSSRQINVTDDRLKDILSVYTAEIPGMESSSVEINKRLGKARDLLTGNRKGNTVDAYGLVNVFQEILNTYDNTDAMRVLGFRSPPPGGNEPQRYTLEVLKDISLINEYSRAVNPQGGVEYDQGRNKTLTLLNPISLLTMSLGDFDGDPYTTIYSNFMDLHREVYNTEVKVKFKEEIQLKKIESLISRKSAISGLSLNENDIKDYISNNQSTLEEEDNTLLNEWLSKKAEIASHRKDISVTNLKITAMNRELENSNFNKALRREISNYIGVNQKHFLSVDNGGYRDVDISTDVALTFIEQGRGLFGGLEEKAPEAVRVNDTLKSIFKLYPNNNVSVPNRPNPSTGTYDIEAFRKIIESSDNNEILTTLRDKITNSLYASNNNQNNGALYSLLLLSQESLQSQMNQAGSTASNNSLDPLIRELRESRNFLQNEGKVSTGTLNDKDIEEILAYTSARAMTQASSLGGLKGMLAQSTGTSMDFQTSDMMVLTMGKAGSDVLGKIYNTFIGAIYRDSPLIATSHVMTQGGFLESIRNNQQMRDTIALEGLTVDDFVSELKSSQETTESLHGFIKDINQLLRDGIKPKGGQDLLENLKKQAAVYETLQDPADKEALITKIASSFGPSGSEMGLFALMELSSLEAKREELLSSNMNSTLRIKEIESGIGQGVSTNIVSFDNKDYQIENNFYAINYGDPYSSAFRDKNSVSRSLREDFGLSSEQFNRLAVEIHKNTKRESVNAFEIASLKATRDLQSLIISYQYHNLMEGSLTEESVSAGGSQVLESTYGRYLQEGRNITDPNALKSGINSFRNRSLSINEMDDFDNWIKGKISSDSRISYIGSTILGVSEEEFNTNFINGTDKHLMKNRAAFLAVAEQGLTATSGMLGNYGEGMERFTSFETARKKTGMLLAGSSEHMPDEVLGSDLWMTVMNLMSSDKLKPHAASAAFRIIAEADSLFSTDSDALVTLISGIDENDNVIYNQGTDTFTQKGPNSKQRKFRKAMRALLTNNNLSSIEVEGTVFESDGEKNAVFNYLNTMIEESATSMRNKALEEFIQRSTGRSDLIFGDPSEIINKVIDDTKVTPEQKKELEDQLSMSLEELKYERIKNHIGGIDPLGKPMTPRNINMEISKRLTLESMSKAQENSNKVASMHDMILPGLLSVVGGAILGGRLDEEVVGDIVGGTIMSMAYMKQSRIFQPVEDRPDGSYPRNSSSRQGINNTRGILSTLKNKGTGITKNLANIGVGALSAGTFKIDMALMQHEGDHGDAMAYLIGTELGFAVGSNLVSPLVEGAATKLSTAHLDALHSRARNYEAARLTSGQRTEYLLKGTAGVLDEDQFAGVKSSFSTVGGAILSGLLGIASAKLGGSVAVDLLNSNGDFSEIALVEGLMNAVDMNKYKAEKEAFLRQDSPDVTDEFGYPVDQYLSKVDLMEDYSGDAISPDSPIPIEYLLDQEAAMNGQTLFYG